MSLKILEVLGSIESLIPFDQATFAEFIAYHVQGLDNPQVMVRTIVEETQLTVFSSMTLDQLLDSAILIAAQNIQRDPDYEKVATRIQVTKIYLSALPKRTGSNFNEIYQENFIQHIKTGIKDNQIEKKMEEVFDLKKLASVLNPELDDIYSYIGIITLQNRYMIKNREQLPVEAPQFTWMRVAMGLSLPEKDPTAVALQFYSKLSTLQYIPGGSTIIGAGTPNARLSNCFLLDTEDDIKHIFENVSNVALISKATGGIGLSLTKLRAEGSEIKSNNTKSSGPIPFAHVLDSTIRAVSRAGKKMGALCFYMENWHYNFPEFLDLKKNNGDDYRRTRTANTAAYISDEFMKRVENNDEWYLFDPGETPDLPELYGSEFSKRYAEYVALAKEGKMKMFKTMPAKELFKKMLTELQASSHPWITWKDTINLRALNNNTGTIHCSNLCTEVCLPQDRQNVAVCNLLYVNMIPHVEKINGVTKIDWNRLEESVRLGMRHLDNLVEVNEPPIPEAVKADRDNRAVGLGIMGFSETCELFGVAYDTEDAYELIDSIMEFVSYHAIDESANLASEKGSYPNYKGSMWSKGFVPYDTVAKVEKDRNWDSAGEGSQQLESMETSISQLTHLLEKNKNLTKTESTAFAKALGLLQSQTEEMKQVQEQNSPKLYPLLQNRVTNLNWDALRAKVKKGIRNATCMMIAPNASTGLVAGTTPGIDPRFAQIFSRATSNGKFLDINRNLVNDLKELGIWEETRDEVLEKYGDISEISQIPQHLKDIYKTCFQVSPTAFIEVASRAQKWIDQSMSRNMYLETRDTDEMAQIYSEAWRRGLKTTYYLHVKPRHTSEQSTQKVNKAESLGLGKGFGASSVKSEPQPLHISVSHEQMPQPVMQATVSNATKGFGFKASSATAPKQTSASATGFGFTSTYASQSVSKLSSLKESHPPSTQFMPQQDTGFNSSEKTASSVKSYANNQACPIDPMEREACEGCQ
jgi:ribonucleoside-diphosphate reductase alpha chain